MPQLPFTRMAYATVAPSGDSVGEVSSPAASVTRVKYAHRGSAAGRRAAMSHAAAAAASAIEAISHGIQAARVRARGTTTSCAADCEEPFDSVSSANARSLHD